MHATPTPTLTRRHAILATLGAAAASLANAQSVQPAEQPSCTSTNQARTTIHYELEFKATPERFYQAILDSKQFAAFSGMPADIDPTPGGAFKMFGALIEGRTIELVPNRRIVQAWRPVSWSPGSYSNVHFELKPHANGTSLTFDHTGFRTGLYDHLDWGWKHRYWEQLQKYFA